MKSKRYIPLKYKIYEGTAAWLLHRISGLALTLYLILHILSMRAILRGKDFFESVMRGYWNIPFKIAETLLFAAIIFHSLNGIRIAVMDVLESTSAQKIMFWFVIGVSVILFAVGTYFMWSDFFENII